MLCTARLLRPLTLTRYYSVNAIPDLQGLEYRWAKMKEGDQLDVLDYLNDKQAHNWNELTVPEKRALYYIYFGNWGPRSEEQTKSVATMVIGGLGGGLMLIALGVALHNYAIDWEKEEKFGTMKEQLFKLQKREGAAEGQNKGSSKWWFWR